MLIGIPFDRPVVSYGGKTINTLRLWAAAAPDYFDFQAFSHGEFVSAVAETLAAESLTRVLYPDDSTARGQGLRFVQEYFLVACSLADLVRRFRRGNADWSALPAKVAIQLNDTHPAIAVPELMRILLDVDRREDCQKIVAVARRGGRTKVGCIILGRGEDDRKVREWLMTAATVPGFIGFAVGRTDFWEPLIGWRAKKITRQDAVAEIARRYRQFVDIFERARAA